VITLKDIGSIVLQAALASAGTLAILSTRVGEKYFSHRLERSIEKLKHEHDEQIESLRAQLSHLSDRGRHANEREFEALSEIWDLFVEAFLSTNTAIASFMEYPDFSRMPDDDTRAFLDSTNFSEDQRKYVMSAQDRNKAYSRTVTIRDINKAGADLHKVRLAIRKKGIFIPKSLADRLRAAVEEMSKAYVARRLSFTYPHHRDEEATNFLSHSENFITEIGELVRDRLIKSSSSG
jgi:hypothetical protein